MNEHAIFIPAVVVARESDVIVTYNEIIKKLIYNVRFEPTTWRLPISIH